jgi:ABC-type arginine transport system ATPase subunit
LTPKSKKGKDLSLSDRREPVKALSQEPSARLELPAWGRVIFDSLTLKNKDTGIKAVRRRLGMVFQDFALFAHLPVLKMSPWDR